MLKRIRNRFWIEPFGKASPHKSQHRQRIFPFLVYSALLATTSENASIQFLEFRDRRQIEAKLHNSDPDRTTSSDPFKDLPDSVEMISNQLGFLESLANVDHCFGCSPESGLGRAVSYRNFIVILQDSIAIQFENFSHALHAE